jgi:hypothetical protein
MNTIQYTLPSWTLCSLFNNDDSGLEERDIQSLDKWISKKVKQHVSFHAVDSEDLGFCHDNDLDQYTSDCHLVTFSIDKE